MQVSRSQRNLNRVYNEMEGKYLTNDMTKKSEDEVSKEDLKHRQKEALRHVILQVFAYIPIRAIVLKYPAGSVKGELLHQ